MTQAPLPIVDEVAFEAARFAYEAPENWSRAPSDCLHAAIDAYLAALVSPPTQAGGEPVPVAWQGVAPDGHVEITRVNLAAEAWIISGEWFVRPLYATPIASKEACGDGSAEIGGKDLWEAERIAGDLLTRNRQDGETIRRLIDGYAAAIRGLTPNPGAAE